MLNDVNSKPSPKVYRVYSCKSFLARDGNGHKFKDKDFLLLNILINILSGRFFSSCPSLICKTKFEYRNQIRHPALSPQPSSLGTLLMMNTGWEYYWPGLNVLMRWRPGSMCRGRGRPRHKLHPASRGRWPAGVTSAMRRISLLSRCFCLSEFLFSKQDPS